MKRIYFAVQFLIFFLFITSIFAQSFSISEIKSKNFPRVKANFTALDAAGLSYIDLATTDFSVSDNGINVNPSVNVECILSEFEPPASIVLVLDRSKSMEIPENNEMRWNWVVEGAKSFVGTLKFIEDTKVAIISFNDQVYLTCPFTDNKQELYDSLNNVTPDGGTLYNPPFLDKVNGAVKLLSERPSDVRRIIVFLTDGDPNERPSTDSIIKILQLSNIQAYCITMLIGMNEDLRQLSFHSGGKSYEVWNKADLNNIYRIIAGDVQKKQLCEISWDAPFGCNDESLIHNCTITFLKSGININRPYLAPHKSIAYVETSEKFLSFGNPAVGKSINKEIIITPKISSFNVSEAYTLPSTYFNIIDWGGKAPPFNIALNDSRVIKLRFTQGSIKDYREAALVFEGEPCPPLINLYGGNPQVKLIKPNGGEIFSICDSIEILWSGILSEKPVDISFSSDAGVSWTTLKQKATGHNYNWLSQKVGDNNLIRVSVPSELQFLWAQQMGGRYDDAATSIAVQNDGLYSYITGWFDGLTYFDKDTLLSRGGKDIFLMKLDSDGNVIWAKSAGGLDLDTAAGVAIDPSGNIYITGLCNNGAMFGSQKPNFDIHGVPYCFLAKYNSSGGFIGLYLLGATNNYQDFKAWGLKIRCDNNNVYVQGQYTGNFQIGSYSLPQTDVPSEFTATYNFNLNLVSLTQQGTIFSDYSQNYDYDQEGNKYECGSFENELVTNDFSLTSKGAKDLYLIKHVVTPGSSDTSDFVFSVDSSSILIQNDTVIFEDCILGFSKDTILTSFICNNGKLPVEIIKTEFIGQNPTDFMLNKVLTGKVIQVGECDTISLRFEPNGIGYREAKLKITSDCANELNLFLSGNGICSAQALDKIDFGLCNANTRKDTIITCALKNLNNSSILIDPIVEGTNSSDFRILPSGQMILGPDSCLLMNVSFTPTKTGNRTALINYRLPSGCDNPKTELSGDGVNAILAMTPIDWKERRVLSINDTTIKIINESSLPLKITAIDTDIPTDPNFNILNKPNLPYDLAAGDSIIINLSFNPQAELEYSNSLKITVETLSEPLLTPLHGIGIIPKIDAYWLCEKLIKPGDTSLAHLVVKNPSKSMALYIYVCSLSKTTDEYNWLVGASPHDFYIDKEDSVILDAEFTPKKAGLCISQVYIISDAAPGPAFYPRDTANIPIGCDALGITVDTIINFGSLLICDSDSNKITIKNESGITPVTINDYHFSNADSVAFSCSINIPKIIAPQSKEEIKISFYPQEQKQYETELVLQCDIIEDLHILLRGSGKIIRLYVTENEIKTSPGKDFQLIVNAEIPEINGNNIKSITAQVHFYELMLKYRNGSLLSTLNNWNWEQPLLINNGLLQVSGVGNLQVPYNGEIFSLTFDAYLSNSTNSDIFLTSINDTCVIFDSLAAKFFLKDVCFLEGRMIRKIGTYFFLNIPEPNPANDETNIRFGVGCEGLVTIKIFNIMGDLIQTITNENYKPEVYEKKLKINNFPTGIYFIRMNAGTFTETRKFIVTKD